MGPWVHGDVGPRRVMSQILTTKANLAQGLRKARQRMYYISILHVVRITSVSNIFDGREFESTTTDSTAIAVWIDGGGDHTCMISAPIPIY